MYWKFDIGSLQRIEDIMNQYKYFTKYFTKNLLDTMENYGKLWILCKHYSLKIFQHYRNPKHNAKNIKN